MLKLKLKWKLVILDIYHRQVQEEIGREEATKMTSPTVKESGKECTYAWLESASAVNATVVPMLYVARSSYCCN